MPDFLSQLKRSDVNALTSLPSQRPNSPPPDLLLEVPAEEILVSFRVESFIFTELTINIG